MATTVEPRTRPEEGERRFLLWHVGWDGYQTLLKLLDDRPIFITYSRGDVELMTPNLRHERFRHRLGFVVRAITEELDIPMLSAGRTTFHRQDLDRGLEADETYYLTHRSFRDRNGIDLNDDPPPDLAIEVEITPSMLKRQAIYAALGVPEIWRFDGEILTVLLLQPDRTYISSPASAVFPFLPMSEVARSVMNGDPTNDTRWGKACRDWVREAIVPRVRGR